MEKFRIPDKRNISTLPLVLMAGVLFAVLFSGLFLQPRFLNIPIKYLIISGLFFVFIGMGIFSGLMRWMQPRLIKSNIKQILTAALICWIIGILVTLALSIKPPTILPTHVIEITATGNKNPQSSGTEVWLNSISTENRAYRTNLNETCTGDWELKRNALVSSQNQPTNLVCNLKAGDFVKVRLKMNQRSGIVKISLDGQATKQKDLFAEEDSEETVLFSLGSEISKEQTALNVLFTIAYGFWTGLFVFLINIILPVKQTLKRAGIEISKTAFTEWFLSTTEMFQKIISLAVVISIIGTIALFSLPAIVKDSTELVLEEAPDPSRPNIILIIVDALTAEDMSLYDYSLPTTPNLDEITKTWTIYANAISPSTCSMGFLPSIITGRYHSYIGIPNHRVGEKVNKDPEWVDIFSLLDKAGYDVWQTGYLTPGFLHLSSGIDHFGAGKANAFMHKYWILPRDSGLRASYFPYISIYLQKLFPGGLYMWNSSLEWLKKTVSSDEFDEPWFLYYHYSGAHGPSYYSPDTKGTFLPVQEGLLSQDDKREIYGKYDLKDQDKVDKLRLRYNESIMQQDIYLAELIQTLKNEGLYDTSMIVITADHGQNFANGYSSHCTPLVSYPEAHVPLLIKYPFQMTGRWIDSVVSTVDLGPTFLDVAGIVYDSGWFDGRTLLDASEEPNERIVFSRNPTTSSTAAINSKWKLTMRGENKYLYNYLEDPQEMNNVIEQFGNEPEVIIMSDALTQFISMLRLFNTKQEP